MNDPKVAVVLMTWKRISGLKHTLKQLSNQTYKNFKLHISNGNLDPTKKAAINRFVHFFKDSINVEVSHDGNDLKSFRRLYAAKKMAEQGYDIILFLDDDISIPPEYVANCIKQYEPKSYKSGFVFSFEKGGADYYKYRTRRFDNEYAVHYCGTGVAMIDPSIFFEEGLFDPPPMALEIEDLWLSYYADHVLGWKLAHMKIDGTVIEGDDAVALFKKYLPANKPQFSKADFLRQLVQMGWVIKTAKIAKTKSTPSQI